MFLRINFGWRSFNCFFLREVPLYSCIAYTGVDRQCAYWKIGEVSIGPVIAWTALIIFYDNIFFFSVNTFSGGRFAPIFTYNTSNDK